MVPERYREIVSGVGNSHREMCVDTRDLSRRVRGTSRSSSLPGYRRLGSQGDGEDPKDFGRTRRMYIRERLKGRERVILKRETKDGPRLVIRRH